MDAEWMQRPQELGPRSVCGYVLAMEWEWQRVVQVQWEGDHEWTELAQAGKAARADGHTGRCRVRSRPAR